MKSAAAIVSLGFGFRGGLFFASLFLGSLLGHIYADLIGWAAGAPVVDPQNAALVGMAGMAIGIGAETPPVTDTSSGAGVCPAGAA